MDHHLIRYEQDIPSWDEGLPLGNGAMGCLLWGSSRQLRLSLDRCDLWDCSGAVRAGGEFTYETLIRCKQQGNDEEIRRIFDTPYDQPTPTKLPAGKILVDMGLDAPVSSQLELETALAAATAGRVTLSTFLDAQSEVGFIRTQGGVVRLTVENPAFGILGQPDPESAGDTFGKLLSLLHYEAPVKREEEREGCSYRYFTQKISDAVTFGVFLLCVDTAAGTRAVYTVCKGQDGTTLAKDAYVRLRQAMAEGWEAHFVRHTAWWHSYWEESFIHLDDAQCENNWYIANYLLASCSRQGYYPMPLQGVWPADQGCLPPWKGDYHHDLNTQISYSGYLKANHMEEGACFIDYLLSLKEEATAFAKEFYGGEGLCLPSVMDIEGNPLGGWPMYSLSPTNTAWLCKNMIDHYAYTGDTAAVRERVYPYVQAYARFLLSLLQENEEGKLVLPISSSPEIHDNTGASFVTPNSTYDLSLMRYVFEQLIRMAEQLELADEAALWRDTLAKMDPLPVAQDGCLLIARDERLTESHRHFSHLMAIYPLRQIGYDTPEDRRIVDGSLADVEKLGIGQYVGFSLGWRAELFAVQRNGDKAYEDLKKFWTYYCLPNGFHCNGDYQNKLGVNTTYRIFTLEGNMIAADALQEMLLYDDEQMVRVAPAVPAVWKNFSFKLRTKNGALITAAFREGRLQEVTAQALRDCAFTLYNGTEKLMPVCLKAGETVCWTA